MSRALIRTSLIVVGGSSGSGKTRLSRTLGELLNWPVIARDDFKEILLDAFPPADRAESMRLGGPSWPLLYAVLDRLIGRVPGVILESNFRAGRSEAELLPRAEQCETIYLHCTAAWETVAARLHARKDDPTRHPGHFDAEAFPQVQADWANDAYRPLELGLPVILVRTDARTPDGYEPALADLIAMIERLKTT
jgi:predicted kinase